MGIDFRESETKDNLMRAFAGESQARNRYTFAAYKAQEQKQEAIAQVFWYTAEQEREHAEVFYDHLKEMAGETIHIDGGYPVDITDNLAQLLRMAQHNEYEEHDVVYKAFAETAKKEGFDRIAASFTMIAGIEKTHGERFGRFAQWMEDKELYTSKDREMWICLKCGFIYEGERVPETCPVCQHDQGSFVRAQLSPYL